MIRVAESDAAAAVGKRSAVLRWVIWIGALAGMGWIAKFSYLLASDNVGIYLILLMIPFCPACRDPLLFVCEGSRSNSWIRSRLDRTAVNGLPYRSDDTLPYVD